MIYDTSDAARGFNLGCTRARTGPNGGQTLRLAENQIKLSRTTRVWIKKI